MSFVDFLNDDTVKNYLEWDSLVRVMEKSLVDISKNDGSVIQPPRLIMKIPDRQGVFLNMPGYSKHENSLGCKLVSAFPNNKRIGMPSIQSTILLFDPDTGILKVVMQGNRITGWRTAAASVVATKYLHSGQNNVLAILGAGVQAETHALAFNHIFNFNETRIWNRTKEHAEQLASTLPFKATVYDSSEECVRGADVICTTTFANEPILMKNWLKHGAHVNAVGAGISHFSELEEEIYRNAFIAVEHRKSADNELKGLMQKGIDINCEVGELILKNLSIPTEKSLTVFQSMGLALEDVTAANLVYSTYMEKKTSPI